MEFEIITNLDTVRNQEIMANFDAVSEWLNKELAPYIGMVVTEDMIPSAKTYRANIRKVKERIEQYRKEAKNAALAPYNEFEAKCKVLTGKLDAAAENLDMQVKDFERREAEAKIAEIKEVYLSWENAEAKLYRPWETVVNPKWANKGYSINDAKEEVRAALNQTEVDIASIRAMSESDAPYLLAAYKQAHDMGAVLRKAAELETLRKLEKQRKADMSEANETTIPNEEDLVTVDFRVTCTKQQLAALGNWMRQNGIAFGRCDR